MVYLDLVSFRQELNQCNLRDLITANGKTYVGSILKPGQRFFMSVMHLELDEDAVLRFDVLERTEGMQLVVCFDDQDCPYSSTLGIKATDNNWNEISLPLPAKIKTVSRNQVTLPYKTEMSTNNLHKLVVYSRILRKLYVRKYIF